MPIETLDGMPHALTRAVGLTEAADYLLALQRLVDALAWQPELSSDDAADAWDADLARLAALEQLGSQPPQSWLFGVPPDAIDVYMRTMVQDASYSQRAAHRESLNRASLADLFGPNVRGMASAALQSSRAWALGDADRIWQDVLQVIGSREDLVSLVGSRLQDVIDASGSPTLESSEGDLATAELVSLIESRVDVLLGEELADRRVSAIPSALEGLSRTEANERPLKLALVSLALALERLESGSILDFQSTLFAFVVALADPAGVAAFGEGEAARLTASLRRIEAPLGVQLERVDLAAAGIFRQSLDLLEAALSEAGVDTEQLATLANGQARFQLYSDQLLAFLAQPAATRLTAQMRDCLRVDMGTGAGPALPMPIEEFSNCLTELELWATESALQLELSGGTDGPFEPVNLRRELKLDTWQRINYWRGYVADRYPRSCAFEADRVVNPLVWALSVRAMRWLVSDWPAYGAQPIFQARLDELSQTGERVADALRRQTRCEADAPNPMLAGLSDYETLLNQVEQSINDARGAFRAGTLKPGADVLYSAGADQPTNYRPPELMIDPCRPGGSCGMSDPLPVSRALLGLFPSSLLVADQLRMGELGLCYDNVGWTERRATPARKSETRTANYFGKLQFDLYGRYDGQDEPVFAKRLTGTTEYQYLFGENSEVVANDACPDERVGTRIDSSLPPRKFRILPRRLSYITALRTDPARVFAEHWEVGEEWRDRLARGQGVDKMSSRVPDSVLAEVDLRLNELNRELESTLLRAMVGGRSQWTTDELRQMARDFRNVETGRNTLRSVSQLMAGRSVVYSEALRASLFGRDGLIDRGMIEGQLPTVADVLSLSRDRHTLATERWRRHASRLAANPGADVPALISRSLLELQALRDLTRPDSTSTLAAR